jgi:hypothetical protein
MAKRTRKKGTLKGLSFDEVSFVGQGANQNAHVSIIKMEGGQEEVVKRMFEEVLTEILEDEKLWKYCEELFTNNNALRQSVSSIIHDEKIQDKKAAILQSLQQFVQVFTSMVLDTDVIKSGNDIVSILGELKQPNTEVTEVEKGILFYKAMAGITDDQKATFLALKEADQEAILKSAIKDDEVDVELFAKSIDGKKVTKKRTVPADETFEMDGETISKAAVGEAAYKLLKAQSERMTALEKQAEDANKLAKEERDARILKELSEEAVKLWPNLPGDALAKGKTLLSIRSMPEDIQKGMLSMMAAGNSTSSVLFKEVGHGGDGDQATPTQKLEKMAKEHAAKTGVDFHKAYTEILDTPDGQKLYEESLN